MSDILFEDLYTYTNKYHKDAAARSARPITRTLADIAKTSPNKYNNVSAPLIPYPGDAIVEALGNAYTKTSDATYLISQLFDNPSVNYSDETKSKVNKKLNKIMDMIKSISIDLDQNDKPSDT